MLNDKTLEEGENPFKDVRDSLAKTVAMFIGELDYGDLPETQHQYKWLFQLFLVTFIILIVVIFANFLNGLAIGKPSFCYSFLHLKWYFVA